jgi:hypothetical protein
MTTVTKCWALAISCAILGGCASQLQVVAGRKVEPGALEKSLQVGKSKAVDITALLGEPYGRGRELLPFRDRPRTVWQYYYEVGALDDIRRIFIFVYLDGDRYDGYLWFSSLPH